MLDKNKKNLYLIASINFLILFNLILFFFKFSFVNLISLYLIFFFIFLLCLNNFNNLKIIIFFFILILFLSLGTVNYGYDSQILWLFYSKRLFLNETIFQLWTNYSWNPNYPYLVPALVASFSKIFGFWNEIYPKTIYVILVFYGVIVFKIFFKKFDEKFLLIAVLLILNRQIFNGYHDGILAVFSVFIILYSYIYINNSENNNFISLVLFFTFLLIISLTKKEGFLILTIILTSLNIANLLLKRKIETRLSLLILLSLIIAFGYYFYSDIKIIESDIKIIEYDSKSSILIFLDIKNNIQNIFDINQISYFLKNFLVNRFYFITMLIFNITFFLFKSKLKFFFCYINIISFIYLVSLFIIYSFSSYDFYWHLDTSFSRVSIFPSFLNFVSALYLFTYSKKFN